MIKKINLLILLTVLFLLPSSLQASSYKLQVIYNENYYNLGLVDSKSIMLTRPIAVRKIISKDQAHRVRVDSFLQSKLDSLLFVGDSYSFNKVKLSLIQKDVYQIEDLEHNFKLNFNIGLYDSVVLFSFLNFYNPRWNAFRDINDMDYIASGIAVKKLLESLSGKLRSMGDLPLIINNKDIKQIEYDYPELVEQFQEFYFQSSEDSNFYLRQDLNTAQEERLRLTLDKIKLKFSLSSFNDKTNIENYTKFVDQLRKYGKPSEIFEKLSNFVNINFRVVDQFAINDKWVNPYDLLHTRVGDYKSIAFFYYYTLKELGLPTEAYFVAPIEKRKHPENRRLTQQEIHSSLIKNRINPTSNLDVTKYKMPRLDSAVFLVALNLDGYWSYTTGKTWNNTKITRKERVCSDYSKNGCYYSVFMDTLLVVENIPIYEGDLRWEVFFDTSFDPD